MVHAKLTPEEQDERLLTPAQVGTLLGVDPKTVRRWSTQGKLPVTRTLGGHRRFRYRDIQPFLAITTTVALPDEPEETPDATD